MLYRKFYIKIQLEKVMELSDYLYNEFESTNEKFYEDEKIELEIIITKDKLLKNMSLSQKKLLFQFLSVENKMQKIKEKRLVKFIIEKMTK